MKEAFLLYQSFEKPIARLTTLQKGNLLDAIFQYNRNQTTPELDEITGMAFDFLKIQFDIDLKKYDSVCQRNRQNGALGGRPSKNPKNPDGFSDNPVVYNEKPRKPKKPEEEEENENDYADGNEKENEASRQKFTPPTLIEIENYFLVVVKAQKLALNAKKEANNFFNHYQSNGWKVGKNKMANWKSSVDSWLGKAPNFARQDKRTSGHLPGQFLRPDTEEGLTQMIKYYDGIEAHQNDRKTT